MHCIRSYSAEGMTGNVQYGDTDNNNNNKLVVRLYVHSCLGLYCSTGALGNSTLLLYINLSKCCTSPMTVVNCDLSGAHNCDKTFYLH